MLHSGDGRRRYLRKLKLEPVDEPVWGMRISLIWGKVLSCDKRQHIVRLGKAFSERTVIFSKLFTGILAQIVHQEPVNSTDSKMFILYGKK